MTECLDARWIGEYEAVSGRPNDIDTEFRLPPQDLATQQQRFTDSGFSQNPLLQPQVDLDTLAQDRAALVDLRHRIDEDETDPSVIGAYVPRLNELAASYDMLEASARGDTQGFIEANTRMFGEPDRDVAGAVLGFFHRFVDEQLSSNHQAVREIARQAKDVLPDVANADRTLLLPSDEDFARIQALYSTFYDQMFEGMSRPEHLGGEAALQAARKVLANLGFDYKPVPQREGVSTMSVNHVDKQVKIPQGVTYPWIRFAGLMGHEVRTHIEERVFGEQQPLRILYSGLAGFLRASEGKGILAEQVPYSSAAEFAKTLRFFGLLRRHLSVSLAGGVDGNGPRDFKEVFGIIHPLDRLWEARSDPDNMAGAERRAIDNTWELLAVRSLRGWTGRGAAFRKEMVYCEGHVGQSRLLARNPGVFPYLNLGKYDGTNTSHINVLEGSGVVPRGIFQRAA